MRIALALALFALPAVGLPAAAQASDRGEDRYGPPAPRHSGAVSYPTPASAAKDEAVVRDEAASYRGPYLSWSGKAGARQPVQTAAAVAPPPAPAAQPRLEARYAAPAATPLPAPPLPQSLYARPASGPASALARPQPLVQAAAQPAPPALPPRRTQVAVSSPVMPRAPVTAQTSPAPTPTAAAHTPLAVAAKTAPTSSPAAATTQVAPTQVAMAAPPPPPQPPAAPVKARFYSLHRDYGDAPDPVTLPVARPPVLVGPAETATAPQSSNSDDHGEGGSDKPKPLSGALY